jgi:hypothetical protein
MNVRHASLLLTVGLSMAACAKQESAREIDWAKSALARNPAFEIVATDESAGVFTVKDTRTGETRTLKLNELIAAPLPAREITPPAPAPESEPPTPEQPVEAEDPALVENQTTEPQTETVTAVNPGTGSAVAAGPGYSITRGQAEKAVPATALEGPGYKIEAAAETPAAESEIRTANVEKRTDPIICQGNRLMRIDGETIEFTGDAIVAERGCDLYISNARIRAGGVGIIARQQARVHIVNSTIGGTRGSYEASDGAEIYVARSTFTGVGRRFGGGSMTDLGGNSYQSR